MRETGYYQQASTAGEQYKVFVPHPLPPDPPLKFTPEDYDLIDRANRAIGRLDGLSSLLPDPSLFLYFCVRKEAVLSSQIEGTQSSLSDLLLYESKEAPGVPLDEVEEVSNYVKAMNHALRRIREDDFPLSLRLIRETHKNLLAKGRGKEKSPGEFRRTQNWIGGTRPGNARYVPPPPDKVLECMGALEKSLHDEPVRTPLLIKAGLVHVQFETIHPFLDGNGRIGRLLITLLLCSEKALQEPLLYLSLFFKQHRETYYELLQSVRETGNWESWLRFFFEGIYETAQHAVSMSKAIMSVFDEDQEKIGILGRASGSAFKVHQLLKRKPILRIQNASKELGLTPPTVRSAIKEMIKLGLVSEMTGRERYRLLAYTRYIDLLSEGTEVIRR